MITRTSITAIDFGSFARSCTNSHPVIYFLLWSWQHFFAFLPELHGHGSFGFTFPALTFGACFATPPIDEKFFPSTYGWNACAATSRDSGFSLFTCGSTPPDATQSRDSVSSSSDNIEAAFVHDASNFTLELSETSLADLVTHKRHSQMNQRWSGR